MDDISILGSRRNGKAVWMVEITDSRMNFFVNSKALSFLGLSSLQTGNRVQLHTGARPGGRRAHVRGGGPPWTPHSCCQELLPFAAQLSRWWVANSPAAVPWGAGTRHPSKHQVKAPGEQMDGIAVLPEDAQGVGRSSTCIAQRGLFCFCFPGMIVVILLLLVAIVVVAVWPTS